MAKPLKTESPTAAEWSGENVTMIAATAAIPARASCTCRSAKRGAAADGAGVAVDTVEPGFETGILPV